MNVTQRYRLVRTIASGGMAQVLEAVCQGMEGFERRVAIKRLLPQHLRDGGRRRMFFDEASIGSRLHHGGVVQIFDYGLIDGAAFIAMEFVDGVDTLRAMSMSSDENAMPEAIALHVISEVAHALAYIHDVKDENGEALKIVHRDVSPQNILLSWDGDVKLSDFGIALSLGREERTAEGVVKGKLPYMPPEQALGKRVDSAADVYALGATLATLLGAPAMGPAMTEDEAASRVNAARLRGVSPAVAELIGACTCPEPSARLRAADVAAAAGSLATQKLSRCARGSLRDWLAALRPRERQGSALDDLMGLCLVPVAADDGGRQFTVSQVMPLRLTREARTSAPIEVQSLPPPPVTGKQHVKRWVAGAVVAAAAAALVAWRPHHVPQGGSMAEAAALAPAVVAAPALQAPAAPLLPPAPPPSASHASPATPALIAGAPTRSMATRPHRSRRAIIATGRIAGAAVEGGESVAVGWVRVGGAEYMGGKVSVDGVPIGFAPLERSLPVGVHSLTIVSPGSGHAMVRQLIRVGGYHTRVRPLALLR